MALPRWESTVMAENSLALTPMVAQLNPTSKARLYQKSGSTGGFSAYVVWIPQESWGFVLLANRSVPNVERVRLAHALWETTKK
jgi:CubicO group peptidase (beta-lactamase class C family)